MILIIASMQNKKRLSAMLKTLSALQTVSHSRKSFYDLDGVKPTGCGSQPLILWDTEAVALAPPPTHAVHCSHIFLLITLMTAILPDCAEIC